MKLDQISFFQLASERMSWLSARQKVIAGNIANADTPGFRAQDVTSFSSYVDVAQYDRTKPVTEANAFAPPTPVKTVDAPDSWSRNLSGNTVVLEQQTVKSAETATQYRLAADLYRKAYQMLTTAVTGN